MEQIKGGDISEFERIINYAQEALCKEDMMSLQEALKRINSLFDRDFKIEQRKKNAIICVKFDILEKLSKYDSRYENLLRETIKQSLRIDTDIDFKIKAYLMMAYSFLRMKNETDGENWLLKLYNLCKDCGDTNNQSMSCYHLAKLYLQQNDFLKVHEMLGEGLHLAKKTFNIQAMSQLNVLLGVSWMLQGYKGLALDALQDAVIYANRCKNQFFLYQATILRIKILLDDNRNDDIKKIINICVQTIIP